jgi:hypothetical protein
MKYRGPKYTILLAVLLVTILFTGSCSTSAFFYLTNYNSAATPDSILVSKEDVYFRSADTMMLHGWFIKPRSGKILGTILHFHGNAGNVGYYLPVIMPLVKAGFQCMVWDYQQYGASQGIASQEHVLEDGIAAVHYVKSREDVKGTKLILFGQSLGGHLALVVAAREQKNLYALAVEGAFTGHHEIAAYHGWRRFLSPPPLTYIVVPSKYEARKVVNQITIPKLFIHSTDDKTCPYFMGQKLFEKAIAPKEFWKVDGYHCRAALLYPDEFVAHFVKLVQ